MTHQTSLTAAFRSAVENRNLIIQMSKRTVLAKYKGSIFGFFWTLINPLFMLIVYTFAFSVVFKSRWGLNNEGHFDFALILFVSLIVFNIFSETVKDAPTIITSNASYVKKVVFPLEILPVVSLITALINAGTSFAVMFVLMVLLGNPVHLTIIYFPAVVLPLILITLGLSYLLASIGVFLRDISQIVSHLTTILLFTSPIFFSMDRIPEMFRKFAFLNPLGLIVEESRKAVIFGHSPDWKILGYSALFGIFLLWAGFYIFQRLRKGFADVL